MARETLLIRHEQSGEAQQVEVTEDGSVSVRGTPITVLQPHPGEIRAGERTIWAARDGDTRWVFVAGQVHTFEVQRPGRPVRRHATHEASLSAPMPATVVKILTAPGNQVRGGDVLIILEAMKMELPVRATADGVVVSLRCSEGELVQPGQDLIEIREHAGRMKEKARE
jgi:biotin carboxyl carrier protein